MSSGSFRSCLTLRIPLLIHLVIGLQSQLCALMFMSGNSGAIVTKYARCGFQLVILCSGLRSEKLVRTSIICTPSNKMLFIWQRVFLPLFTCIRPIVFKVHSPQTPWPKDIACIDQYQDHGNSSGDNVGGCHSRRLSNAKNPLAHYRFAVGTWTCKNLLIFASFREMANFNINRAGHCRPSVHNSQNSTQVQTISNSRRWIMRSTRFQSIPPLCICGSAIPIPTTPITLQLSRVLSMLDISRLSAEWICWVRRFCSPCWH